MVNEHGPGDPAAVPDVKQGTFHPPTAQHGLREALTAAKNIEAAILGRPVKPFVFTTLGQLATIGHHSGVAMVFGIKFFGFVAWWLWRMVYLLKLPRWAKKLRVMMGWTLDVLFGKEIEQMVTLRDVQTITAIWRVEFSRARSKERQLPPPLCSKRQLAIDKFFLHG